MRGRCSQGTLVQSRSTTHARQQSFICFFCLYRRATRCVSVKPPLVTRKRKRHSQTEASAQSLCIRYSSINPRRDTAGRELEQDRNIRDSKKQSRKRAAEIHAFIDSFLLMLTEHSSGHRRIVPHLISSHIGFKIHVRRCSGCR